MGHLGIHTGTPLRNAQHAIGWKIDTRAHGGYAIPPARRPPGGHELIDDRDPGPLHTWMAPESKPRSSVTG